MSVYHSSLYGYEKQTNPLLSKRKDKGELLIFDNAVSLHDHTTSSLEAMLSLDSLRVDYTNKALFPICFKKAGYHTEMFDNQYFVGSGYSSLTDRELSEMMFENFDTARFDSICKAIDIPSGVFEKKGKSISKLSDGNQTKLMLACVLARKTDLLLLDEPASPLDPLMRDTLSDMIRKYIADGEGERSVFFSTHNISDMEGVTDYVMIMEQGQIVEQGFVVDLKEKYLLIKGDSEDLQKAKPYLLPCQSNSYGFEGICLADKLDQLAGAKVSVETPSLFQISVAIMKQSSRLQIPDIA